MLTLSLIQLHPFTFPDNLPTPIDSFPYSTPPIIVPSDPPTSNSPVPDRTPPTTPVAPVTDTLTPTIITPKLVAYFHGVKW